MGFDGQKEFEITEETKTVAAFISTYVKWTDGLHDSGSIVWDGIVQRFPEVSYINAIAQLQNAIANWESYSDKLESLDLNKGNSEYYLESLGHMEVIAR